MRIVRTDAGVLVERPDGDLLPVRYIVGIGRNYGAHAAEQGMAPSERVVVFTKNPMAACCDGEEIVVPTICQDRPQVDYEGELAVVLGRPVRDIAESKALTAVLGYCCANDVSARWWQKEGSGGQYCRGKSFDTFCPLGPELVPASSVPDPQALRIVTRLNGEVMQEGSTSEMTFSVATLIAELSRGSTLPAGTVILTGTPAGVGMSRTPPVFLEDGQTVEVEIESIGTLRNGVRFE